MEKMLLDYLKTEQQIYQKLHPLQFGSTPGKGCTKALSALVDQIEPALHKREFALVIFMDIRGAFDNVSKAKLIEHLKGHGCPQPIAAVFEHFLDNRSISIEMGEYETTRHNLPGGSQGTSAMPLKWNVGTTSLLETVNSREYMQGVVDDLASVITGPDVEALIRRGQWVIDQTSNWCSEMGLELSTDKTKYMVCTHNYKNDAPTSSLLYQGTPIGRTYLYRYLGIDIDPKLTFAAHYDRACTEAVRLDAIVNRTIGTTWGLNPTVQRWIWSAIFCSKFLYGCHVTLRGLETSQVKKKVRSIHYRASKRILGCSTTTPKLVACSMAAIEPVEVAARRRAITNQIKDSSNNMCPSNLTKGLKWKSHRAIVSDEAQSLTNGNPIDECPPDFKVIHFKVKTEQTSLPYPQPGDIQVYSDGSVKGEYVGGGWCLFRDGNTIKEGQCKLHSSETITSAETKALHLAAEDALRMVLTDLTIKSISFFTDSMVVVMRLSKNPIKQLSTNRLVNILNNLALRVDTTVNWCPGHMGITGNERADTLAKEAAAMEFPDPENYLIPQTEMNNSLKKQWKKSQVDSYRDTLRQQLTTTNLLIPHLEPLLSDPQESPHRNVINFLSNRGTLGQFLYKRKLIPSPNCRFCGLDEPEDNEHILCVCPGLYKIRAEVFNSYTLPPIAVGKIDLKTLFNFLNLSGVMDGHPELTPVMEE
eukprot:sb/3462602/